jgi:hypothetical protein
MCLVCARAPAATRDGGFHWAASFLRGGGSDGWGGDGRACVTSQAQRSGVGYRLRAVVDECSDDRPKFLLSLEEDKCTWFDR